MTKQTAAIIATLEIAIARIVSKQGQFLGYIAQPSQPRNPDGSVKAWYEVRWNGEATRWECNCASHRPCRHIAAVEASCAERKAAGQTPCPCDEVAKPIEEAVTEPVAPAPAHRRTARIAPERIAQSEQAMPPPTPKTTEEYVPMNAAMAAVFAKPTEAVDPHAASAALFAKFREDAKPVVEESKPDEAEARARASFASMSTAYNEMQTGWKAMSIAERHASLDAERRRNQAPLQRRSFSLMR